MKPDSFGTATYLPQVIEEYRGNPFIEALPPIFSPAEALDAMTVAPSWNSGERELDAYYRFHCVQPQFAKAISTEILWQAHTRGGFGNATRL